MIDHDDGIAMKPLPDPNPGLDPARDPSISPLLSVAVRRSPITPVIPFTAQILLPEEETKVRHPHSPGIMASAHAHR